MKKLIKPGITGQIMRETKTTFNAFQSIVEEVIPQMQTNVEHRIVKQHAQELSDLESNELIDAFLYRKFKLQKTIKPVEAPKSVPSMPAVTMESIYSVDGKGLSYMTQEDIGKYVIYPYKEYKKIFPVEPYGSYIKDELIKTRVYSVMCREESLKIANILSMKKLPSERKYILSEEYPHGKFNINDQHEFSDIYQCVTDIVRSEFEALKNNEVAMRIYDCTIVVDSIITLTMQCMNEAQYKFSNGTKIFMNPCIVKTIAKQLIELFILTCKNHQFRPVSMDEILEFIDDITISLTTPDTNACKALKKYSIPNSTKFILRDYQSNSKYTWKPKIMEEESFNGYRGHNLGALVYGPKGIGKSQVMTFSTLWAKENNWFVLPIVKGANYTYRQIIADYHYSGLHIDFKAALQLATTIRSANIDWLNTLEVNPEIYGKCDLAGVQSTFPNQINRRYYRDRDYWSDEWKNYYPNEEIKTFWDNTAKTQLDLVNRKPKEPKKLIDLLDAAIKEPILSTSMISELLEQLKKVNKCKVLITVDEYNDWFTYTNIKSFRYENDKKSKGRIPGYDFAIPYLFMKLDSYKFNNCFKLFSSSSWRMSHNSFVPGQINVPSHYGMKVRAMNLNEFRYAMNYFALAGYVESFSEKEIERHYVESQGNLSDFHKSYFDLRSPLFGQKQMLNTKMQQ